MFSTDMHGVSTVVASLQRVNAVLRHVYDPPTPVTTPKIPVEDDRERSAEKACFTLGSDSRIVRGYDPKHTFLET